MHKVKKEEFLGLIRVLEHLDSTNRPNPDVTAANNIKRIPISTPSLLKLYGMARVPAPTIVFTKFAIDERALDVGSIS